MSTAKRLRSSGWTRADGRPGPGGENTIDFVYQADGYSLASKVSLAALAVFVLYAGYFVWKKKKHC